MGLDSTGTTFLFAARAAGVSFRKTATLGRQGFAPEAATFQKLLDSREAGHSAERFLRESGDYAEKLFQFLGAEETVAIDNSAYEGASIVADMNVPIAATLKERFSAIVDGGCLEHVFNFPQAIRNCMDMLSVGGHFVGITPANNFCGHGFYQFSPELFFRVFSPANGFVTRAVLTKENERWYRVIDPEKYGGRVELQNNRPTYLFVLAEKVAQREVFSEPPQQSDYARQWKEGRDHASSRRRDFLRTLLSPKWKDKLRPLAANFSIRHRYPCYQPIAERSLLSGDFGEARRSAR